MGSNSFYSESELSHLGLKAFGENVLISRKASLYSPENISMGSNVRIDDFCILSGHIMLGSYIHISAYCALYGAFGIEMGDFTGLSPRCTIFSASDDFGGEWLIGPMVPAELTNVKGGRVKLNRFVQLGAGSMVLPGVEIGEGSVTGAMSLVTKDLSPWGIYAGVPVKLIREREKNLVEHSKKLNKANDTRYQ